MSWTVFEDWWLHLANLWKRAMAIETWNKDLLEPDSVTVVVSALSTCAILLILLYKCFWVFLPVRVRCWFCGGLNRLPVENRNHFDCLHCEQYNGFSALGDYNKDIPAQRNPAMNVFSVGATPSGKTLQMYHNGLCELCNYRQEIKVELRNRFEPKDPFHEEAEFKEHCRRLEITHALCTACKQHVRTRLAYQDAKLLPHLMSLEASRWHRRLGRLINSELTELIACLIPAVSFAPVFDESWTRLVPLAALLPLMLAGVVHNRALVWTIIIRGVSIAAQMAIHNLTLQQLTTVLSGGVMHPVWPIVLNGISVVFGLVALFKPVETLIARLLGRKRSLLKSAFTALPNLSKALAPLLSPAYRTFLRSRNWAKRAPFDLGPRISSLSIGSDSRSSPGLGMSASTFGPVEQTASPRGQSDIVGGQFHRRRNIVPGSGPGLYGSSLGGASGAVGGYTVLRPSRLSDAFNNGRYSSQGKHRKQSSGKQSQLFGETYNNLTPPPSQDSSLTSSEESLFPSACPASSVYTMPAQYSQCRRSPTEVRDGFNGLASRTRSDHKDWDTRTTHTVYSTVVHECSSSSPKALWALVFLVAATLVRLCWSDLISIASSAFMYGASLSGHLSSYYDIVGAGDDTVVCPAR